MCRATATVRYPSAASLRTIPRPNPRLPPVTTTLRMMTSQFARSSNLQRRQETDRRRNLVCGEVLVTDLQDFALEVRDLTARTALAGFSVQNDVGDDQRTRDGTS